MGSELPQYPTASSKRAVLGGHRTDFPHLCFTFMGRRLCSWKPESAGGRLDMCISGTGAKPEDRPTQHGRLASHKDANAGGRTVLSTDAHRPQMRTTA